MNDERTAFPLAKCETCGKPATTWISDTMNVDCSQEYIEYDMYAGGHFYCKACLNDIGIPGPPLSETSKYIAGWESGPR